MEQSQLEQGLMEWRRDSSGKLDLWIKDQGEFEFKPYTQSKIHTPVTLETSSFAPFRPGFRTAQTGLKNGYKYRETDASKLDTP